MLSDDLLQALQSHGGFIGRTLRACPEKREPWANLQQLIDARLAELGIEPGLPDKELAKRVVADPEARELSRRAFRLLCRPAQGGDTDES